MNEKTKEEQILILDTLVKERKLIIKTIEDNLNDIWFIKDKEDGYVSALEDEIENHKIALQEYKEGLEKIKQ